LVRNVLTRLLPAPDLPSLIQDLSHVPPNAVLVIQKINAVVCMRAVAGLSAKVDALLAMCGQGQGLTRSETAPLASQKPDATVLLKTIKSEWTNSKLVVAAPLYFVGSPPSDARGKTATLILAVGGASVVAASGFHSPGGVVLHSRTNKSITDFSSTAKYVLDWHKEHFGASSRKVFCAFSGLTQFSPENPHEVEAAMEVRNQYAWSHITTSTLDLSFKYVFLFQVNKVKGVPTPPPLRPPIDWSRVEQESLRVEQEEEDIRLGRR